MVDSKSCFCIGPENCKDESCEMVKQILIQKGIVKRIDVIMDKEAYESWKKEKVVVCSSTYILKEDNGGLL